MVVTREHSSLCWVCRLENRAGMCVSHPAPDGRSVSKNAFLSLWFLHSWPSFVGKGMKKISQRNAVLFPRSPEGFPEPPEGCQVLSSPHREPQAGTGSTGAIFTMCSVPSWLRRCESQPERGRAGLEAAHDEVKSLRRAA